MKRKESIREVFVCEIDVDLATDGVDLMVKSIKKDCQLYLAVTQKKGVC